MINLRISECFWRAWAFPRNGLLWRSLLPLQTATIAFDTAKVRLQIKGSGAGAGIQGTGLLGMVLSIARTEGPAALFKGLTAGLQRQLIFGTLRLGMYEPVRFPPIAQFNKLIEYKIRACFPTQPCYLHVCSHVHGCMPACL